MKQIFTISLLLISLYSTTVFGQDKENSSSIDTLTIRDAIKYASMHHPGLLQLRSEILALKGARKANGGLADPVISYAREGMGDPSFSDFSEQRLGISQEIKFPGVTSKTNSVFSSKIEALELEYRNRELQLREEVKKKYSELQLGLEKLNFSRNEFGIVTTVHSVVQEKYRSGEATRLDLLKAKINMEEASNLISEAQFAVHNARYSLFNLIGLETEGQKYSISFPDSLTYQPVTISQDEILSTFYEMPGVLSKMKMIEASANEVAAARQTFYPDIKLNLFGQNIGTGFKSIGLEIGFTVPLWFNSNQNGMIEEAEARLSGARESYREELLLMKKEVEIAWHGYEAAKQNLDRYTNGILRDSKELLDLTTEGYKLGEIDFLNLLEAQRTYLTSSQNYYNFLLEYHFRLIELEKFSTKEFLYNE